MSVDDQGIDVTDRRFVSFLSPGSFTANYDTREIDHTDPRRIEWPEGAYAFELLERRDVTLGGEVFKGETRRVGPLYYHHDSRVRTVVDVEAMPGDNRILLDNMRCNGWDSMIFTRWGNWPQPFNPETCVVLPQTEAT